jgi:polyhydroxybutyrate depolymerase
MRRVLHLSGGCEFRGFERIALGLALVAVLIGGVACRTPLGELQHGGLTRTYLLHVPANATAPLPVLVVLHGGGGNPRQVARYTGFDAIADREGFLVVYPGARDKNWNDGRGAAGIEEQVDDIDDVGFIVALVDELARLHTIDRTRVYATGISNGAIMSFRLACERAEVFSAIAPVVGALAEPLRSTCTPERPVAVLAMNGTDDTFVPIDGGDVIERADRGRVLSVDATLAHFASANGCDEEPSTVTTDRVADDRTSLETVTFSGCDAGGDTKLHRFVGGGHTLPGVDGRPHEPFVGVTSQELDGPNEIWRFVSRFRRE